MQRAIKLYQLREVLQVAGISRRTLRMYEEVGLVSSSGREGRTPMYAEDMLETILRIQRLRSDLGVNLAGIQVILEMRRKMEDLHQSLEEVVTFVQEDLRSELEQYLRRQEKAVVPKHLTTPWKPPPRDD